MGLLDAFRQGLASTSEPPSSTTRPGSPTASLSAPASASVSTHSSSNAFPATPTRRRPREESILFDDKHLSPISNKRLKTYGTKLSRELDIPEADLHSFVELASPLHMLMDIKAHLISSGIKREKSQHADWITSPDCKNNLQDRLGTVLLSPNLTAYVTGLADQVVVIVKRDPSLFKIPADLYEDPSLAAKVATMIKDILTQYRSSMKLKLGESIEKKWGINDLTKKIAPAGMEKSSAIWARTAFLRACYVDFQSTIQSSSIPPVTAPPHIGRHSESPTPPEAFQLDGGGECSQQRRPVDDEEASGGTNDVNRIEPEMDDVEADDDASHQLGTKQWKPSQFWAFVDEQLQITRKFISDKTEDKQAADAEITTFFTKILQEDWKKYPVGPAGKSMATNFAYPAWQSAIHDKSVW